MIGFAVCLDADVLVPRSIELGVQTIGVTLIHGTLLAALTWLVTRLKFFRLRPALTFALWALVLLKFFMPSGPALVRYGPSALFSQAVGAFSSGEEWIRALGEDLLARPRVMLGLLVIVGYSAIVLVLIRRWLHGQWALARAVSGLPILKGPANEVLVRCARALDIRAPEARITEEPWTPMVVGCMRPVVVLPSWILAEPELLESVLLHELGHIRRHDPWSHQVQRLAEAVFFFWPVVYWVTARLRESREMACDALALTHGSVSAHDYGCALLRIARRARCSPQPAMLGAASCGRRMLERRIDYLLEPHPRERWTLPAVAGIAVWGLLVLSGAKPQEREAPGLFDAEDCRSGGWLAQKKPSERRVPSSTSGAATGADRPRPSRSAPTCGCRRTLLIHAEAFTPAEGAGASTRSNFPRCAAG